MKKDGWKNIVFGIVIFSLLIYLFSPNFVRLTKAYRQIQVLEDEIERLQSQNQSLQDDVSRLKSDPLYVEKIAREELGMARPKEIIYKFEDEGKTKETTKSKGR